MLPLALGRAAARSGGLLVILPRVRFASAANHRKICFWSRERRTAAITALWPQLGATRIRRRSRRMRVSCLRKPGGKAGWRGRRLGGPPARPALLSQPPGVQVARVDNPGRGRHHLAGRQRALRDQPPDDCGTDSQLRRGLLERQPVVLLRHMGQALRIPHTRHTVRPPSFPGQCDSPRDAAWPQWSGRDRPWSVRGAPPAPAERSLGHASRGMPCHPQLRVHPAVPVGPQQGLRGLLERIDANRMQHRPPQTFFSAAAVG